MSGNGTDARTAAELARSAWQGMRSIALERHDGRREVSEALGMSFIRVKALRHLAQQPVTLRELAASLTTDAPYTTLIVHDLAERGLVVRSPHPDDRRAKLVTVTEAGRQAAEQADAILGMPPPAMQALAAADLAELERIMTRMLALADTFPSPVADRDAPPPILR